MNKAELIQEVEKLIKKGKTKEAFQLLSKAQLSKNDRRLILLMGQYSQLEEETLTNQLSHEEEHRLRTRIHNSVLNFLEKIDHHEIATSKKNVVNTFQPNNERQDGFLKKYKYYLLPVLLIPLIILVFISRTPDPEIKPVKQNFTSQINSTPSTINEIIPDDFLKKSSNVWKGKPAIYFEDFSNRNSKKFRNDIWKFENDSRDHWMGVVEDLYYKIKINNGKINNTYTRHKYLGDLAYDASKDIVPYYVKVKLSKQNICSAKDFCMGRGPTIRYNKSKRSAYAFTLNDNGQLQFRRLKNFNKPMDSKLLFSRSIKVESNKGYELGIVAKEDKFFLYLNREIIKIIQDDVPLIGAYAGVVASGEGEHFIDEVGIFNPINN